MIRLHGKDYPLPEFLMRCTLCKRGHLRWNGHRAWACYPVDSDGITFAPNEKCKHALSIEALFEDRDLDLKLQQHVDIEDLQLSHYALLLIIRREIELPWVTQRVAAKQYHALIGHNREESDMDEIETFMRVHRKGDRI